jgi:hypothetical protein
LGGVMIEHPSIYTDGHSLTVRRGQAARLQRLGLIELHPGSGEDGILPGDFRLTVSATWAQVYVELDRVGGARS